MAATNQQPALSDALATFDARCKSTKPVAAPLSREEVEAIRAALDAKFRAGDLVMNRNSAGQFTGAVRVLTFGGSVEAVEPAFKYAAE